MENEERIILAVKLLGKVVGGLFNPFLELGETFDAFHRVTDSIDKDNSSRLKDLIEENHRLREENKALRNECRGYGREL